MFGLKNFVCGFNSEWGCFATQCSFHFHCSASNRLNVRSSDSISIQIVSLAVNKNWSGKCNDLKTCDEDQWVLVATVLALRLSCSSYMTRQRRETVAYLPLRADEVAFREKLWCDLHEIPVDAGAWQIWFNRCV